MGCIWCKKNKSQSNSEILREHAIESVANSPSLDSLLHVNGQVVQLILESKEDIRSNPDLHDLVQDYFSSSTQLFNLYAALENCITKSKNNHIFLQLAVTRFDKEKTEPGDRFSKTLRELDNFKSAGDPLTEEFFALFLPVYNQQVLMLSKLQAKKEKLDRKLKGLRLEMEIGSLIAKTQLENIQILAGKLKNEINTMLFNVGVAVEGEDEVAVSRVIEEIKKNLEAFMQAVDFLGKQSDNYSRDLMSARYQILQKICIF